MSWPGLARASTWKIALVQDDIGTGSELLRQKLIKETSDLMGEEICVFSPPDLFVAKEDIKKTLKAALEDPRYDIVVALGPACSNAAVECAPCEKPLFAPFIINTKMQNTPLCGESSGVKNFSYITLEENPVKHIALLKKIAKVEHLAFMVSEDLLTSIPAIRKEISIAAQREGIHFSIIGIKKGERLTASSIPQGVDALYLAALSVDRPYGVEEFAKALIDRGIKSYSLAAAPFIEEGLLASLGSSDVVDRLMRRVALSIQRVSLGQKPEDFNVYLVSLDNLVINTQTATALGLSLPFDLLLEACLVDECVDCQGDKLSLIDAVCEGIGNNSYLGARWHELQAACQIPNLSRSALFPHLELGSDARVIDRNTALLANGLAPERLVDGFLGFRQMIYSNELIGQYFIDREIKNALVQDYNETYLQIVFDIAAAYFSLLRSKTIVNIQKNNLNLTQHNLMLAEQRVAVGVARMSEIYRWESQLSNNKANLIIAGFRAKSDATELLRLLNRPQAESIQLVDVSLEEDYWLIEPNWFELKFNTASKMENLANFVICEGFRFSPKIYQYLYTIAAKTQSVGVAKRAFWTPDLFLNSAIDQRLFKGGAATDPLLNVDTQWVVGLEFRFPLFTGGARMARLHQAKQELRSAQYGLDATCELVEEQIRVNLYNAAASYASIGLTKSAFLTAKKNLELVSNNYSKGQAPIIDLLDAQTQVLIAELEHTDAIFSFLTDLVSLQRSIGRFDFLLSNEEQKCFKEKLQLYLGKVQ